jgi:hypothetical protein
MCFKFQPEDAGKIGWLVAETNRLTAGFPETRLELTPAPNYSFASNGSSWRVKARGNIRNQEAIKSVMKFQRLKLQLELLDRKLTEIRI